MSANDPKDIAPLREAFASLRGEDTSDPVDSERIFDALHGSGSPEERQAVVEQLLTNPAAAEAWRLAREMRPDAAVEGDLESAPPEWRRPAAWTWMSVAAAALLAVGLGWQVSQWREAEEPVYRSSESRTIASALPGADLSRTQPVLRWSGVEGARYRVRVLSADLQVLEESEETPAPQYSLSAQALARIPPGGQILWQVDARIPGEEVITSPTFSNRVP